MLLLGIDFLLNHGATIQLAVSGSSHIMLTTDDGTGHRVPVTTVLTKAEKPMALTVQNTAASFNTGTPRHPRAATPHQRRCPP